VFLVANPPFRDCQTMTPTPPSSAPPPAACRPAFPIALRGAFAAPGPPLALKGLARHLSPCTGCRSTTRMKIASTRPGIGTPALRSASETTDGVILGSPEYNHGMSGVLKNAARLGLPALWMFRY